MPGYVEFDGEDSVWFAGDADSRARRGGDIPHRPTRCATPSNRVLATVLFTDIVGSTERASAARR